MKVLLFNPRSSDNKYRIPNSVLQVAASIEGKYEWVIVDGNRELDAYHQIRTYLDTGEFKYIGFTVMPGPQLREAIPFAKKIRHDYPGTVMIWGGYFPSNQFRSVLYSGYVDYIINGPGDFAFPGLIDALENKLDVSYIKNICYLKGEDVMISPKDELPDYDSLNPLPYEKLNGFYSLEKYLGNTYLGTKTLAYHSSFGCPFTCSFCAVVPIYEARWKGKSALGIYNDVKLLKDNWGANAIEFHDNNFFVSEKRVVEFSHLIKNENMVWWGEGRIDTINKYSDESLTLMRNAGCKMIFFGAETGNNEVLKKMDKGGTQSGELIASFVARMKKFDIIPEYSFVLGFPGSTTDAVMKQIDEDISFIKSIKEINPHVEIIIYVYSPVPTEGSDMYNEVLKTGFKFPVHLEDWLNDDWANFDLRKNPLTPWLTAQSIHKIKNFETILNAYYPTVTDIRLTTFQRKILQRISRWRYENDIFNFPFELKLLQKMWRYRQPEVQGF